MRLDSRVISFQCCFACNGFSMSSGRNYRVSIIKFQCCFACNGFSINGNIFIKISNDCFNAALPAMGLVLKEWELHVTYKIKFQCCFACNGFSIYVIMHNYNETLGFQCCFACNGFSIISVL